MVIEASVPSLIADCTGGKLKFPIEANTVEEAIARLLADYPKLRVHLYDETDQLRQHVLIFYNDQNIAWMDRLDVPLRSGDQLIVFQAVSGG